MSRIAKLLVCFVTASGGCATATDELWTPTSGDGKADGYQLLKGSDIPSQLVDPAKTYVATRSMFDLDYVNGLTGWLAVAENDADGSIPGRARDRILAADELVALEQKMATLPPTERTALSELWSLLEIPDVEQHIAPFDLSSEDRSTPYSSTTLAVPSPGHHESVFVMGGIKLSFDMYVGIHEDRYWRASPAAWTAYAIEVGVPSAGLAAEGKVLVRELGSGATVVRGEPYAWPENAGGDFVFERFVGGQMVERHRIVAPPFSLTVHDIRLSPDYRLELADGTQLVRNVSYVLPQYGGFTGSFTYDLTAHTTNADPASLAMLATPVSTLSPGRYQVNLGARVVTLELYSSGVVKLDGQPTERGARDSTKFFALSDLEFVPTTNQLRSGSTEVTVTTAMRIP